MLRIITSIFLLVFLGGVLHAQYVNTDELVVVPGNDAPLSIEKYEQKQKQLRFDNRSLLSRFLVPGDGGYVISRYGPRSGRMHYGTDLKMNKGDTVVASFSGMISRSQYVSGYGYLIVIQHENNLETYYAHLSKFLKKKGSWVAKGEAIGLAGSTGRARGNHLHFEMREKGKPFDSELVFDYKNQVTREDAMDVKTLAELHKKLKPKGYSTNVAVPEYYKVRPGDSLWKISRRFKTSISAICRLNRIRENSVLQIGQALRLY